MGDQEYTTAIDVWSMGIILLEMAMGRPYFSAMTEE